MYYKKYTLQGTVKVILQQKYVLYPVVQMSLSDNINFILLYYYISKGV